MTKAINVAKYDGTAYRFQVLAITGKGRIALASAVWLDQNDASNFAAHLADCAAPNWHHIEVRDISTGTTVYECESMYEHAPAWSAPMPTYEQFEQAAREAHQQQYDADGDRYATAEELAGLLACPLENSEVGDTLQIICLRLGAKIGYGGHISRLSLNDRESMQRRIDESAKYRASKSTAN